MFKRRKKRELEAFKNANPSMGRTMTPEDIRREREQLAKLDATRGRFEQRDGAA